MLDLNWEEDAGEENRNPYWRPRRTSKLPLSKLGFPQFISVLLLIITASASAATHYVDLNCTNPTPRDLDWPTAATNIQDAVDLALDGDTVLPRLEF